MLAILGLGILVAGGILVFYVGTHMLLDRTPDPLIDARREDPHGFREHRAWVERRDTRDRSEPS